MQFLRPRATAQTRVRRRCSTSPLEEAGEGVRPVEAVVDRFGRVTVLGEPGTLFAQPSRQFDDQWPATLLAHAQAASVPDGSYRGARAWSLARGRGQRFTYPNELPAMMERSVP